MTITINGTTGITNDGGYTGDGVVFADTTPANTLVTTTGGNVGIGTSSPSVFTGYTTVSVNNAANGGIYNILVNGTETARLQGYSGIFNVAAKGASTALTFETNGAERARIDSSGRLLVGTTTAASAQVTITNPSTAYGLQVAAVNNAGSYYQIYFSTGVGGTTVGSIVSNSTSTTYVTSSDYRLKEDVQPMAGALSVVQQLKPCTYKWKADGSEGQGFIAHELQAVFPDAVVGEKDAVNEDGSIKPQGIDTSFLVATLTAAIQEQQAIILAQESALNALTARVAALENQP